MIRTEKVGERIRHYSDGGFQLRQVETGILYDEAVDVVPVRYTYEETDLPIETDEAADDPETAVEADYLAALRDLGVDV